MKLIVSHMQGSMLREMFSVVGGFMNRVRLFLENRIVGMLGAKPADNGGGVMKRAGLFLAAAFCVAVMSSSASAASFFSKGDLAPNLLTSWSSNSNGVGGSNPANF